MFEDHSYFVRRLLKWYRVNRRDLPWRLPLDQGTSPSTTSAQRLDPYHVFVSEAMLQQTQVATVIPYFQRFIARYPTFADLARSNEQDVLRLWQGLGYYSRARNLRSAAMEVARSYGGHLPSDSRQLLRLPGVGRYTAGAIASIAFGCRVPILDGNVARVLCRLDRIQTDPREKTTQELLWTRAAEILPAGRTASRQMSDFNSALMELGAMVCTPRKPQCLICPVQKHCEAFAAGLQESIPPPRKARPTPLLERWTFCIHRQKDRVREWLIEQRPSKGRWAGMWQFVTRENVAADDLPVHVSTPTSLITITHTLTHRRYIFHALSCHAESKGSGECVWATLKELNAYAMPGPHVKIAAALTMNFQALRHAGAEVLRRPG